MVDPSGEIATRPHRPVGISDSAESSSMLYRRTAEGAGDAGRIHAQPAARIETAATAPIAISANRRRGVAAVGTERVPVAKRGSSNASANAFADPKRSAGSFASARSTAVATFGGTLAPQRAHRLRLGRHQLGDDRLRRRPRMRRLAGEHLVDDARRANRCRCGASITRSPVACSGLMYCGVPSDMPVCVTRLAAGVGHGERDAEVGHHRLPVAGAGCSRA